MMHFNVEIYLQNSLKSELIKEANNNVKEIFKINQDYYYSNCNIDRDFRNSIDRSQCRYCGEYTS